MNGEEEFFDAVTGFDSDNSSGEFSEANQRLTGVIHVDTSKSNGIGKVGDGPPQENGIQKHRTSLPAPMFTRSDFSVWSILKKCIGLELSKITMPIAFNEPLSFLQRITEYMEHVYLIHRASRQPQSLERMQSVAAFAVSAVASQWERTGKPFNPLLGETYELIREDLGFRFISEQVSHHPPISAFYSEGLHQDFLFHGSIYPKLKFWGKSVEAEPRGTITLELLNSVPGCGRRPLLCDSPAQSLKQSCPRLVLGVMWGLCWGSVLVQLGYRLDEPLKTTRQSLCFHTLFPGRWQRPGLLATPLLCTAVQPDTGTPQSQGPRMGAQG